MVSQPASTILARLDGMLQCKAQRAVYKGLYSWQGSKVFCMALLDYTVSATWNVNFHVNQA